MIAFVIVVTALILGALLWGQWQRWREKRRRRAGTTSVAVGDGHMVIGGCLGVLGYMGLLFTIVSFTFDIVEDSTAPAWLAWVVVFGMLTGFFALVAWGSLVVGPSFASTRLVLDSQGIRLVRFGKTKIAILWHEPWQLEQYAGVHFRYRHLGENYTDYTLLLDLRQGNSRLLLRFDAEDNRIGGLSPYEGSEEGYEGFEMSEWLQAEILHRHMVWEKLPADEKNHKVPAADDEIPVISSARKLDLPLMQALNFNDEDLAFNREGTYKVSQLAHLRRDKWLTLGTYVVLALVFGALAMRLIFQSESSESTETRVAAIVVFLLVFGFCTLMAIASYATIRTGMNITRVRGTVTLQHYEQSGEYWLRVKDTAVPITSQIYEAFEDQAVYDLYFTYHGVGDTDRTLLSAEKITS